VGNHGKLLVLDINQNHRLQTVTEMAHNCNIKWKKNAAAAYDHSAT
jgi:hypothetical protein